MGLTPSLWPVSSRDSNGSLLLLVLRCSALYCFPSPTLTFIVSLVIKLSSITHFKYAICFLPGLWLVHMGTVVSWLYESVGLTEVKSLVQDHITHKWQNWDSDLQVNLKERREKRKYVGRSMGNLVMVLKICNIFFLIALENILRKQTYITIYYVSLFPFWESQNTFHAFILS